MSDTVYKYRMFCVTENAWVYNYGLTDPTTCINNTSHTINTGSISIIDTVSSQDIYITNNYSDTFESSRMVQQNLVLDLKSYNGVTTDNIKNVTGTGTVTSTIGTDSEIKLSINGTSDVAGLRSAKRGYYIAGLSSEVGIALRIPTALVSGNILKFGYFDTSNGYYFKLTGSTLSVCVMRFGTETEISSSSFNRYKLDGTEANGITLDFTKGNIFRIDFTWYGFGQVIFGVIQTNITGVQKFYPMHVHNTTTTTSCGVPNLPINVQLSSNGSSSTRDVYIAGRQYSILGKLIQNERRKMYVLQGASSATTSTNRLFSLRYKTSYKTCTVEFKKIYAMANVEILLQVWKNATLSGSSFGTNSFVNETCLEVDTSSSFSGGTIMQSYLLFAGAPVDIYLKDLHLYEDDTITFTWKATTILSNTMDLIVEWDEKW